MANVDMSRIAGNIGALNALNSLNYINSNLALHQTRLATGKRLNTAADDPAGMLIATTFDVRRAGMQTTLKTIGDAKNLMSVMEGGLNKVREILVKMRNKALEAQGDTLGTDEKRAIADQLKAYRDEINDIVLETQWNGNKLVGDSTGGSAATINFLTSPDKADGDYTEDFYFTQVTGSGGSIALYQNQSFYSDGTSAFGSTDLGLTDVYMDSVYSGVGQPSDAIDAIDKALNATKVGVSQVGAFTARLTFKEEALAVAHANVEAAFNRLMNADMAYEQVEASKFSILQQTATAMLAQANVAPQFLLSLFR